MRKVEKAGFVIKPHAPSVDRVLAGVMAFLEKKGIECVLEEAAAKALGMGDGLQRVEVPMASDLVIVLGGDGTLLSVAHLAAVARVPVMGVNMGRLGFLTEVPADEAVPALEAFLAGDAEAVSTRWLLEVRLQNTRSYCLNDAVVTKGALSRMIELSIRIDGREVAVLKADGVIVSTPTGSTAYNLAAGGPIIHPQAAAVVLTPICPHTLTFRPMVIPAASKVGVKLLTDGEEVHLTLDGQRGGVMQPGDEAEAARAAVELQLVTSPKRNYYDLVKEKLNWAG